MTDGEPEATETNFAEFEAAVGKDEAPEEVKADEKLEAEEPGDEEPKDDDASEVNDKADDDEDEDEHKDDGKRRSKPASRRIAEQRWQIGERDRRIAELEAQISGKPAPTETAIEKPDPAKFEYGEADPEYLDALTDWKVETKLAERDKAAADREQANHAKAVSDDLNGKWAEQTAKGAEKYKDFNEVVVENAQDWQCPPLVAAAISISPVGADVAYHLAKNPDEAELIATQLAVKPMEAAERYGFIEGGYMTERPKAPASDHPLDLAIHAGRLRAFLDKKDKPKGKVATDAPEPPTDRARGAGGQFEVGADTSDFAAFERKARAAAK